MASFAILFVPCRWCVLRRCAARATCGSVTDPAEICGRVDGVIYAAGVPRGCLSQRPSLEAARGPLRLRFSMQAVGGCVTAAQRRLAPSLVRYGLPEAALLQPCQARYASLSAQRGSAPLIERYGAGFLRLRYLDGYLGGVAANSQSKRVRTSGSWAALVRLRSDRSCKAAETYS